MSSKLYAVIASAQLVDADLVGEGDSAVHSEYLRVERYPLTSMPAEL